MRLTTDPAPLEPAPLPPLEKRKRYDLSLAEHDYPEWHGRPTRTILLCSEQRSGSTLLGEVLYFAGDLGCPLEYFHGGFYPDFIKRWGTNEAEAFLRAAHRHRTAPSGTFSAKIFWTDLMGLLAERDAAVHAQITAAPPAVLGPAPDLYRAIAAAVGDLICWRGPRIFICDGSTAFAARCRALWLKKPGCGVPFPASANIAPDPNRFTISTGSPNASRHRIRRMRIGQISSRRSPYRRSH